MDAEELKALKGAAKQEYAEAIRVAKQQFREAMQAIDGVSRLQQRLSKPSKRRGRVKGSRATNGLVSHLERILPSIQGKFNVSDLQKRLTDANVDAGNRSSLSTTMRRLVQERDDLVLVQEGRGRRPAIYERKEDGNS